MPEFQTAIDLVGSAAAAPPPGEARISRRTLAGSDALAMRSAQTAERLVQPDLARTMMAGIFGTGGNSAAFQGCISTSFTATGGTSRGPATTNRATRAKRTAYISAATAAAVCGLYAGTTNGPLVTIGGAGGGGFRAVIRFVPSDAATVAGARMFVGLAASVAAPANVEPNSLSNQIGVGQLSGSGNLQMMFGGSAAQTAIDLGTNFPAAGAAADLYELILFSDPNDNTKVGWRVERNPESATSNFVAEGVIANATPGTTLPAVTTMLGVRLWRTNNATALAVGLDLVSVVLTSDF
jgi:hypothetical protein